MRVLGRMAVVALMLTASGIAKAQTTIQVPVSGNATAPAQTVPYSGSIPITVVCAGGTTATISGTTITCPPPVTPPPPPPPLPPPPPPNGRTKITPSGGNDQPAIYALAAKGPIELSCSTSLTSKLARVFSAAAGCTFKLATSSLPNGADIWFDDGIVVTDFAAYQGFSHMFVIYGNQNITLAGSGSPAAALIQMPLTFAQGNIANNCMWIENSSNVLISGLRFDKCGEDSLYAGKGATNVHWTKIVSTNPLRNGCSVTDQVTNILVDYSDFSLALNKAGGIADGCDVEPNGSGQRQPNSGEFAKQVVFDHDKFHDNAQDGLAFNLYFMSATVPLDYTVTSSDSTNNAGSNWGVFNAPSAMTSALQSIKGSGNTANGVPVIFPATATGKQVYVAPAGSDKAVGTQAAPFATIQHAADMAVPGETIHVLPGTYFQGSTQITSSVNGTAAQRIVFVSDTPCGAKITSQASQVWSAEGQYTDIQGFDISGSPNTTGGIHGQAQYDRYIANCIHDLGSSSCQSGAGILLGGSQPNQTADRNIVFNIGPAPTLPGCNQIHGIYVAVPYCVVTSNVTYHNAGMGIQAWANQGTVNPSHCTFTGNESYGNKDGMVLGTDGTSGGPVDYVVVKSNNFHDNLEYGFYTQDEDNPANLGPNIQYTSNTFCKNGVAPWTMQAGTQVMAVLC